MTWERGYNDPGTSVQSTKVQREPILVTAKWRWKFFPRFAQTDRHLYADSACPPTSNIFRCLWLAHPVG